MCYAWFLSGYNYFNVVIDEKSAFNNARDCFQLFFQRSVNIMETGIKDKVPFSVKIGPSFPWAGRSDISEAPSRRSSFSTYDSACGNTSTGMGNLLPKILTSLLGSTIMKVFPLLLISSFSLNMAPPRPFIRLRSGSTSSAPSNVQSGRVPKGGLRDAQLYASHGDFLRGGNHFQI